MVIYVPAGRRRCDGTIDHASISDKFLEKPRTNDSVKYTYDVLSTVARTTDISSPNDTLFFLRAFFRNSFLYLFFHAPMSITLRFREKCISLEGSVAERGLFLVIIKSNYVYIYVLSSNLLIAHNLREIVNVLFL